MRVVDVYIMSAVTVYNAFNVYNAALVFLEKVFTHYNIVSGCNT